MIYSNCAAKLVIFFEICKLFGMFNTTLTFEVTVTKKN